MPDQLTICNFFEVPTIDGQVHWQDTQCGANSPALANQIAAWDGRDGGAAGTRNRLETPLPGV